MDDSNPSMYFDDDDDDLVENLQLWQLSDQSVIERMASLSDIPPVQVAGAGFNSNGADLLMDMPPPLDRSLSANYLDYQTFDPISYSNHDASKIYVQPTEPEGLLDSENANLPNSDHVHDDLLELFVRTMEPEEFFEPDTANLLALDFVQTMVSEELLEPDNAILPPSDYVQGMGSEDLLESTNHAISMIISSERTQDQEAKNVIDENQQRNNASLVLSDHSTAVKVVAVIAEPPPRQVKAKNPPPDGHNWRKYGQKHVKNSEFPRSYYRCTHPICKATKKIEYSTEGHVAEIIYKGSHNHPKANPSCDHASNCLTKQMAISDYSSNKRNLDNVEMSSSARSACQPKYTIMIESDNEVVFDDGFRWRKYGQKVVKGNSNPRNYYKCTHPECIVRKHIERAPNDIKVVLTTYEGHHKHEVPAARNNMNNNLNHVVTPSLHLGGPRVSLSHHNQANMVLEARIEAPTITNQERFIGFESPNLLNKVPPGTISAEQWASPNVSFGSTIMPFAGLHGPPLIDSRVVMTIMSEVECTQEHGASSSMMQLPLQANWQQNMKPLPQGLLQDESPLSRREVNQENPPPLQASIPICYRSMVPMAPSQPQQM